MIAAVLMAVALAQTAPDKTVTERAELGFVAYTQDAGASAGKPYPVRHTLGIDAHPDRDVPGHPRRWFMFMDRAEVAPLQFDGKPATPLQFLEQVRTAKRARVEVDTVPQRYGAVVAVRAFTVTAPFQKPTLVRVSAGWCAPCQRLKESFKTVPAVLLDRFTVVDVDCTTDRAAGGPYGVTTLPTLIVTEDGKEMGRQTGYQTTDQLAGWLTQTLTKGD